MCQYLLTWRQIGQLDLMVLRNAVLLQMLQRRTALSRLSLRPEASKLTHVLEHANKGFGRHPLVVGELDLALLDRRVLEKKHVPAPITTSLPTSRICSVSDIDRGVAVCQENRQNQQNQQGLQHATLSSGLMSAVQSS